MVVDNVFGIYIRQRKRLAQIDSLLDKTCIQNIQVDLVSLFCVQLYLMLLKFLSKQQSLAFHEFLAILLLQENAHCKTIKVLLKKHDEFNKSSYHINSNIDVAKT